MRAAMTLMLMSVWTSAFTQTTETDYRNDIQINIGSSGYEFFSYEDDQTGIDGLTFIASYNGRLNRIFGFGVYGGLIYSDRNYTDFYWRAGRNGDIKQSQRYLFIGPKLNAYFYNSRQFQIFASAGIGIGRNSYKEYFDEELQDEWKSKIDYSYDLQVGMNYYLSENFGLTGALGVKTALFRIGLTYRY